MKRTHQAKPPLAGLTLYENVFENCDENGIIQKISEGLIAVMKNSHRLLNDVKILLETKKFSSARFLLTTADEEMAKIYILLDFYRLDFQQHSSILKRLCQAFYDHVRKHAYIKIHRFGGIYDLAHAREIWDSEIIKWWPNDDPELGEPDMPHETHFSRELPLYVDYIGYDQKWSLPQDEYYSFYFKEEFGQDPFSVSNDQVKKIEFTYNTGLFEPSSLLIFHEEFKKKYVNDGWTKTDLIKIYEQIDERLFKEYKISKGTIFESIWFSWPLYHFLSN